MEQPPWSFDDLQPQDLSTSSIPNVVDLTRNGSLNVKPCHVHSADWHPNSGLASTRTTASSNSSQPSADQIQPDNALSHTTVTLSYVSSSPINSASQARTGLPPICKFSLLPSCEAEKGLRETTSTLNQHYLEHCDTPVDLVTKAPEVDRLCLPQEICERNGTVSSSTTRREEHGIPESAETSDRLENGRDDSWSSLGAVSLETDMTVLRTGNSETLLQVSKKEEPVQNKEAATELRFLTRECQSPLEEPSATSPCHLEDVLMLPQASASPSGDNSFPADEAAWDGSITEGASLDSSDENRQPRRPEPKPLIDLTDDVCPSGISGDKADALTTPHMNGNVSAPQERKLPLRSNRGVRLQSLVININSSSYKVSGRVNTNADASKTRDSDAINPKKNGTLSNGKSRSKAKAKHKVVTPPRKGHQCKTTTSNCVVHSKKSNGKFTKAMPEEVPYPGHLPQVRSNCSSPVLKNSKKEPDLVHSDPPSLEKKQARCSPPPPAAAKESPKKSPCSPKDPPKSSAAKKKVARTPKKRRKKRQPAPFFPIFAPREPEIKLRYVHYKEEKKDSRYLHFSPFIRLHGQQSSTSQCSVVNYPEEVATQAKKGPREQEDHHHHHHSSFLSGTLPNTSCLQLGRASTQGQRRGALICCLCALSANAMDLGDLHGPYYPEGQRVSRPETSTLRSDLKDRKNDYSDSDSSSCSVGGRGKKRAANQWWQKGLPPTAAADDPGSPAAAKRARSQMWPADVEDWYSAPVLPMEPREYWLHEDCAIWSAGVFLVKGRVYGLEETVKVARQTMCSACSGPGATLGCFFKGCPNKYHYRCALEADCVLVEENFSMKCKKHKNKTLKAPVGMHSDPRRKRPS